MTPELRQRLDALARANATRVGKSLLKVEMKTRATLPLDALKDERSASFKLEEFITSIPGYGKVKARKLMSSLGLSPYKRVRHLSERQLKVLGDELS